MPLHVAYRLTGEDTIRVYESDVIYAITFSRDDYESLGYVADLLGNPGIYVLMDEYDRERYVGQSTSQSGGVKGRIDQHTRKKDFWSSGIAIVHKFGGIGADKLDHLEKRLIREFRRLGYQVQNVQPGNSTHIDSMARLDADTFLDRGLEALKMLGNKDLLRRAQGAPVARGGTKVVIRSHALTVEARSLRAAYVEFVRKLSETLYAELLALAEASTTKTLVRSENDPEPGRSFYTQIAPELWLYHLTSREGAERRLGAIASQLGPEYAITIDGM